MARFLYLSAVVIEGVVEAVTEAMNSNDSNSKQLLLDVYEDARRAAGAAVKAGPAGQT